MDTLDTWVVADGGVMTPVPATLTEDGAWVGISQLDLATVPEDEDKLVVDALGLSTRLGVPDLKESVTGHGV